MKTRPGNPYPLGATWDGSGVNFALFSENATGVELCLFDGRRLHRPMRGGEVFSLEGRSLALLRLRRK
jgi:pullulanase/glycogen debranching enzyme